MENNRGSTTVESVIIIPLIFMLVFAMLVLLLETYDYSKDVLKYNEKLILEEKVQPVKKTFKIMSVDILIFYENKSLAVDSRFLQQSIEFMIYLVKEYYATVKGYVNDQ